MKKPKRCWSGGGSHRIRLVSGREKAQRELGRQGAEMGRNPLFGPGGFQAGIDFPEDVDHGSCRAIEEMAAVHKEVAGLLDMCAARVGLTSGIEVCLVGPPTPEKSSLFNALLAADRAIVTEVPGTTRDILRERTEWNGLLVLLLDTAGLRETSDIVETIGVERAERAASESEVIVYGWTAQ